MGSTKCRLFPIVNHSGNKTATETRCCQKVKQELELRIEDYFFTMHGIV